jgi:hexosaminidase
MSKHLRLIPVLVLLCVNYQLQAQPVAIIPEPVSTQWHDGHFVIDEHTLLIADDQDQPSVSFFNDYLQRLYGLRLHVAGPGGQPSSGYIRLIRTPAADGGASGTTSPEGQYTLEAKPDNITISSPTGPGIFYGIQTLIQLLPLSGRHFFPVDFVKTLYRLYRPA